MHQKQYATHSLDVTSYTCLIVIDEAMMKSSHLLASVVLACAASPATHAQTVDRPSVKEGDKWRFINRTEELKNGVLASSSREVDSSVVRVGSHSFILANKPVDSNLPPHEFESNLDWSRTLIVNGEQKVVGRPFAFPLKPGQTWDFETETPHPAPGTKLLRNKLHYTVLGWEDVKVPGGTFKALKIEMEGTWYKEFEPQGPRASATAAAGPAGQTATVTSLNAHTPDPAGGRMYRLTWYVPEVKRDVKQIAEDYTTTGVVHLRNTQELESYTVN
jgi:hypothetical protein